MSTERKPGSRGVRDTFSGEKKSKTPGIGAAPDTARDQKVKGSTKTVSPRAGFKRKPKK